MPDTADTEALKAGKAALKAGKAAHKLVEQYEQTKNTQEADKVRAADAWKKACDAWEAHRKGETMADFYEQTKPTPEGNKKQNLGWKTLARYAEVLPYLLKRPGRPVDGVTPPLAEIEGLMNDEGGTFRNTSWWSKAIVKEKQQEKKNTAAKKKADTVTDRGSSPWGGVVWYSNPSPGKVNTASLRTELKAKDKGLTIGRRALDEDKGDFVTHTVAAGTDEPMGALGGPDYSGACVVYMPHQHTTFEVRRSDEGGSCEVVEVEVPSGDLLKMDAGVFHCVKSHPTEEQTVEVVLLAERGRQRSNMPWFDTLRAPVTDGEGGAAPKDATETTTGNKGDGTVDKAATLDAEVGAGSPPASGTAAAAAVKATADALCALTKDKQKNRAQARKLYRNAADQGHAPAQAMLGYMYAKGEGGKRNRAQAREWYQKAAEQGDAQAQYFLGYMYEKGKGGDVNRAQAREWYQKAAEQGCTYDAKVDLARMDAEDSASGGAAATTTAASTGSKPPSTPVGKQPQSEGDASTLAAKPPAPSAQHVIDLTKEIQTLKRELEVFKVAEKQNPKKRRVSTDTIITLEDYEAGLGKNGDDEVQELTTAQVRALLYQAKQQPTKHKRK